MLGDPATPDLTATATGMNDILLQWNVPASNGATITGFELQRMGTPLTDRLSMTTGGTRF